MSEVQLLRHAKSYANEGGLAIDNVSAEVSPKGIMQAAVLKTELATQLGIMPEQYKQTVAASEFVRPQQTARIVGFRYIDVLPILNEAYIAPDMRAPGKVAERHSHDGWIPEDLDERAGEFINLIRSGELQYQFYFTHGFFIAAVKSRIVREHEVRGEPSPYKFDPRHGHIPDFATATPIAT